jgi:glycosyltransferase 2 family protein
VAAIIVQAPPLGTPPGARRAFAVRRWGFLGLRLLISATGIFLVVRSVDVGAALHSLADANPFWFVAALLAAAAWQVTGFVQWCLLLPHAAELRRGWMARLFLRSTFVGLIVPAGVGGDAVRAREVGPIVGYGRALAAIAASRLLTVLAVATWTLVGSFFLIDLLGDGGPVAAVLAFVAVAIGGVITLQFDRIWARRRPWRRLTAFRDQLLAELASYRRTSLLVPVVGVAVLSWGLDIGSLVLFTKAVGANVPWALLAVALPASAALTLLPFTVNGLGVREGALIALLAKDGVSIAHATALTVFVDIQLLPLALLGAAAWVFRPREALTPWSMSAAQDRELAGASSSAREPARTLRDTAALR